MRVMNVDYTGDVTVFGVEGVVEPINFSYVPNDRIPTSLRVRVLCTSTPSMRERKLYYDGKRQGYFFYDGARRVYLKSCRRIFSNGCSIPLAR